MILFLKILRFIVINLIAIGVLFGTEWWMLEGGDDSFLLVAETRYEEVAKLLPDLLEDALLPIWSNEPLLLDDNPVVEEGVVFMPISFVESHFNDGFYWDAQEKVLTYTTVNDVIRMRTDDLTYYINDEPMDLQIPIREMVEGVPYIPLEFLKKFSHHDFVYYEDLGVLMIEDLALDRVYVDVVPVETTYALVRTWKDAKSLIVKRLKAEDRVKVIGGDSVWTQVRTEEGFIGYILNTELGPTVTIAGIEPVREVYDYSTRPEFEGGLNLAWNYVDNVYANKNLTSKLEGVHGLDVISPTWFYIKNAEGDIINKADINYVRQAHEQGIQVWALFANPFGDRDLTHAALSSTSARQNMIKQLLALSALYEVDGINIDIESISKETGEHFVQFIKELTPYLKQQGLVVSVDMYVPSSWTAHYGRQEVGEVVDYIMIMAYDEHWGSSPDSGSVASIDFVEKGIVNTLKEVPAEKTVLGLPYYTRIWQDDTASGEQVVRPTAYSMNRAFEIMTDNDAAFVWDPEVGQYYAEYQDEEEGITYKLWHEEERSIEEKVKLMESYGLAGVAGWQIGLEKDEVWDVLERYLE